jgi:exodeoxyribonuclease V beta subunit
MLANMHEKPAVLASLPHDKHAVLEANAGTGKTHILAHLFVDLLLSTPCELGQILAVTFTDRATVELRQRVRQLLETVKAQNRAGSLQARKLESALFSFSSAPIYTIHSFCQQLLFEFWPNFGGSQGPDVVDSRRAFHRAFRAFLRSGLAVSERTNILLDRWLKERSVERLEELLFEAHRHRYLEADVVADHRAAILALLRFGNLEVVKQDYERAALEARTRREAISRLNDLAKLIEANRGEVEEFAEELTGFDFSPLLEPLRVKKRANKREFSHELSQDSKAFLSVAIKAWTAAQIEARTIDAFLPLVTERLEQDKQEQGFLDYDDMLRWAWRMLDGPRGQEILPIVRARLRYGLIDEFHDTDELQWKILRRIFVESESGNVLYLIGDPKQAIYSFRGADVFTYLAARDEMTARGASRCALNENFRSTPAMVNALNTILDQNAEQPLFTGEIQYREASRSVRTNFRAVDPLGQDITPVTLMRYVPEEETNRSANQVRKALGRHLAENLRRILFDPNYEVRITEEDGALRRVEAGDVFVLTRTTHESIEVGSYLREVGVPFAFYKLDGLFQTDEAHDVLDLLKAIECPAMRARRLKAYLTPFFGFRLNQLPPGSGRALDPLDEMLFEWNALAQQQRFAELFDRLLHQSGLAARELLLSISRRRLTNYEQIFETLLEQAYTRGCMLSELILVLQSYIAGSAFSNQDQHNLQRPESTQAAVRILTVHKSKGLEAKIVVLFGGFYDRSDSSLIERYHEGRRCLLAVGKIAKDLVKETLKRERAEEDQRLLYVALTRACIKLYLPFFPEGSLNRPLSGYYAALNRRLNAMSSGGQLCAELFAQENVLHKDARTGKAPVSEDIHTTHGPGESAADADRNGTETLTAGAREALQSPRSEVGASDDGILAAEMKANVGRACDSYLHRTRWPLPESPLADAGDSGALLRIQAELLARHAPLVLRSYTLLHKCPEINIQAETFECNLRALNPGESGEAEHGLEGSREAGIFLHEAIEELSLRSLTEASGFDTWKDRADVQEIFQRTIRRRRGLGEKSVESAMQLIYRAMHWPFAAYSGRPAPALYRALYRLIKAREMEFLYPLFRSADLLSSRRAENEHKIRFPYFRGLVDLIFEYQGLVYVADWKSDILPSYEPAILRAHVQRYYELQIKIYAIAVIRLLQIGSAVEYERRFGGLLYLFIRGLSGAAGESSQGAYFHRPTWEDVNRYQKELIDLE